MWFMVDGSTHDYTETGGGMGPDGRTPLDRDFPQGDPQSRTCRWCSTARASMDRGAYHWHYCTKCDGPVARQRDTDRDAA